MPDIIKKLVVVNMRESKSERVLKPEPYSIDYPAFIISRKGFSDRLAQFGTASAADGRHAPESD